MILQIFDYRSSLPLLSYSLLLSLLFTTSGIGPRTEEEPLDEILNRSIRDSSREGSPLERGVNAQRLETMAYDMDSIPENLCCAISADIMDDPVYDPRHPQYVFDRRHIMRALSSRQENPFTKTPLQIEELRSDITRQEIISLFMKEAEYENSVRPGSTIGIR